VNRRWSAHLHDPNWCRYCIADHPTRAHHDPRDAKRQLERARVAGDAAGKWFWGRIVASLEKRMEG
jgi:hypothetical protein